jgi:hypothetical protein
LNVPASAARPNPSSTCATRQESLARGTSAPAVEGRA